MIALEKLPDAKTVISTIVMVGWAGITSVFLLYPNVKDSPTLSMIIGGWISITTQVIGFYFGSSKSSQDKDATISGMLTQPDSSSATKTPGIQKPP
jgi:hypothetical protein